MYIRQNFMVFSNKVFCLISAWLSSSALFVIAHSHRGRWTEIKKYLYSSHIEKNCSFSLHLKFGVLKWKCDFILNQIASTAFQRTDASKKTGFYEKICIKQSRNWENSSSMQQSPPKYFISIELNKYFTLLAPFEHN
jgi:hypothetical protein